MALFFKLFLLSLASIPVSIDSYQMAQVSQQAILEPSWQSSEVLESNPRSSGRGNRFLKNFNRLLDVDPAENYQQINYDPFPQNGYPDTDQQIESSYGGSEDVGIHDVSVVDGQDYDQPEDAGRPQPAEDRFFLGALAPLALAGLSVPAITTLGIAGVVMLPLAGLALATGLRRIFNPSTSPQDVVLGGPAGQILGNLLAGDRTVTFFNTEFTLAVVTQSTTSTNTLSSLSSTGVTTSYLIYYSYNTLSSTETSVSVSTYTSAVPVTQTSSATSSTTFKSTEVSSSTETQVSVTVPVSSESSTYTSSETSISTTTNTPATETSTTTTTNLAAATATEYTTYTSTLSLSTCSTFYP